MFKKAALKLREVNFREMPNVLLHCAVKADLIKKSAHPEISRIQKN